MKLDSGFSGSAIVDGAASEDMRMKVTGKSFSLFIDKLYTYKHDAVVREICSNARDAMNTAGVGHLPIDIYLPTQFSPYLVIKDQGTGLSTEECRRYFGTMFESSKENENDSIGAYGLGAKSPFSLTDSYNITSIKNGEKSCFQFVRAGRGIPQLILLSKSETDEPNGTEFKINIDHESRQQWIEAIKRQLIMFTPKPIIHGEEYLFDDYIKVLQDTPTYMFAGAHGLYQHFGRYIAMMGGVLYPIHPRSMDKEALFDTLENLIDRNSVLILKFNIGDLEVPPDRERLEYSDLTIENVNRVLDPVLRTLLSTASDDFAEIKNQFDSNFSTSMTTASNQMRVAVHEATRKFPFLANGEVIQQIGTLVSGFTLSSISIGLEKLAEGLKLDEKLVYANRDGDVPYLEYLANKAVVPCTAHMSTSIFYPRGHYDWVETVLDATGARTEVPRREKGFIWEKTSNITADPKTGRVSIKDTDFLGNFSCNSNRQRSCRVYVLFVDIGDRSKVVKNFFLNLIRSGEAVPESPNYVPSSIVAVTRTSFASFPCTDDEYELFKRLYSFSWSLDELVFVRGSEVRLIPKSERKKVIITSVAGIRRVTVDEEGIQNLHKLNRTDSFEFLPDMVYCFYKDDRIYHTPELDKPVLVREGFLAKILASGRLIALSPKLGLKYKAAIEEVGGKCLMNLLQEFKPLPLEQISRQAIREFSLCLNLTLAKYNTKYFRYLENSEEYRRIRAMNNHDRKYSSYMQRGTPLVDIARLAVSWQSRDKIKIYPEVISMFYSDQPDVIALKARILKNIIRSMRSDFRQHIKMSDFYNFVNNITHIDFHNDDMRKSFSTLISTRYPLLLEDWFDKYFDDQFELFLKEMRELEGISLFTHPTIRLN